MQQYAERTAQIQQQGAVAQKQEANKGELDKIREKGKEDRETVAYQALVNAQITNPNQKQAEAEIMALQALIDQSQAAQTAAQAETQAPTIPTI